MSKKINVGDVFFTSYSFQKVTVSSVGRKYFYDLRGRAFEVDTLIEKENPHGRIHLLQITQQQADERHTMAVNLAHITTAYHNNKFNKLTPAQISQIVEMLESIK